MPWTIQKEPKYCKNVSVLNHAEQEKVNEWTNAITGQNLHPTQATRVSDDIGKLSDGTYEFYAGSYHRVFFYWADSTDTVYLTNVGHTLTKK
jgi:hypothetical protein